VLNCINSVSSNAVMVNA